METPKFGRVYFDSRPGRQVYSGPNNDRDRLDLVFQTDTWPQLQELLEEFHDVISALLADVAAERKNAA